MHERRCVGCGATLNSYNHSCFCGPCQKNRAAQRMQLAGEGPNYNVTDLALIMGLGEEQVRRRARAGQLPGRIPGIRRHLWPRQVIDRWLMPRPEQPANLNRMQIEPKSPVISPCLRFHFEADFDIKCDGQMETLPQNGNVSFTINVTAIQWNQAP